MSTISAVAQYGILRARGGSSVHGDEPGILKGILRACGGSSVKEFRKSLYGEYSPRMRR